MIDVGGKLIRPKPKYALSKPEKVDVCKWVRQLKLLEGYASNLAKCANINETKLHGMKSYDCRVFMQWLLPLHLTLY